MGKWCLHAGSFIFDRIIIKVAGNQDRHKSSVKIDFGPNQTTHFGVTCPWVTKISHFWIWISLKPVGQSWSNFMYSTIGVGKRLQKVLGQIGSKLWFPWQQKAPMNNVSGLFTFEWFALIAEKTTFDLRTLDSGEWSLPFGLLVGRTLRLLSYFMCANSKGSGQTARMRRLAWAFAGRLCDKYHNLICWLISLQDLFSLNLWHKVSTVKSKPCYHSCPKEPGIKYSCYIILVNFMVPH